MKNDDEPILTSKKNQPARTSSKKISLRNKIARMMEDEMFAILSTQGKTQPYASIIGYAASSDLRKIYFVTPITTRKYSFLKRCSRVAIQIDNRTQFQRRLMNIESFTATGKAFELAGSSKQIPLRSLLKRHPYFKSFYASPTCAVFEIKVIRYFYVTRFQEVSQWTP